MLLSLEMVPVLLTMIALIVYICHVHRIRHSETESRMKQIENDIAELKGND
ncbi:MAG: hypothetical protein V2B14_01335 [bacterium]